MLGIAIKITSLFLRKAAAEEPLQPNQGFDFDFSNNSYTVGNDL